MKGSIFGTPFYTKINWHDGRMILSRNGQSKGFGQPGSMKFDRRVTFGQAGHAAAGVRGTTSFRGKKVGNNVIAVMNNPLAQQSFGGAQKKEEMRRAKISATERRLANLMGGVRGGSYTPIPQMSEASLAGEYGGYGGY